MTLVTLQHKEALTSFLLLVFYLTVVVGHQPEKDKLLSLLRQISSLATTQYNQRVARKIKVCKSIKPKIKHS